MTRNLVIGLLLVGCTSLGQTAQTKVEPVFKGHKIGESAQEFFARAQMAEKNGVLSADYCKAYLSDPKVQKAWAKAQHNKLAPNSFNWGAAMASSDVIGCNNVNAALAGQDTEVGFRYASEFGTGKGQFVSGKLGYISFTAKAAFDDVVSDMNTKLGSVPVMGSDVLQNGFGATLTQRKATWVSGTLTAIVSEMQSFQYGNMGTSIVVADTDALAKIEKKRQEARPNALD